MPLLVRISRGQALSRNQLLFAFMIAASELFSLTPRADAMFNCLAPNMFKMGKIGQNVPGAYGYPTQGYQYTMGQSPFKKSLFPSKWGAGGSLFGPKNWNPNWRNLYRPNNGYGYSYGSGFMAPAGSAGYAPINERLNVAPFNIPPIASSSYGQVDSGGWSAPLTSSYTYPSTQQYSSQYDAVQTQAPYIPSTRPAALMDPYGTKSFTRLTTTKNNILLANGGYDLYDAHLVAGIKGINNQSFGYTYPSWYSSSNSVDSPARIAQQLFKNGIKRQRQELQNNRSAPLRQAAVANHKYTILDEPRFVGFGSVDLSNSREAKLSCSFNEAISQTNRPLWVKFSGLYNITRVVDQRHLPSFNCENDLCRTQEIESKKDVRYKFDNGPATSTLTISEPKLSDYGTYRCSALTKSLDERPLEIVYQMIKFGDTV